jgi:hypothetical protein
MLLHTDLFLSSSSHWQIFATTVLTPDALRPRVFMYAARAITTAESFPRNLNRGDG